MKKRTLTLIPLLVVGLAWGQAVQRAPSPASVSPATLRALTKGNRNDLDAAEALGYGFSAVKTFRLPAPKREGARRASGTYAAPACAGHREGLWDFVPDRRQR